MKSQTGNWAGKQCRPCEGNVPGLDAETARCYVSELEGWKLREDAGAIQKEYLFRNFREVIQFFNAIAEVAESENHHPDLKISYRKVFVELSTHAVKGLSENDFILAAKFDRCYPR